MKYNIGFTLGDPRGDGHACTTDYHIVANHSADEISKAYKRKLLNSQVFDFIKEVGVDFSVRLLDTRKKFTKRVIKKLGIIDEKYVRESDAEWGAPAGCYEFDYAEEEFVDLYFCYSKKIFSSRFRVEFQRLGGRNFVGFIWSSLWLHVSWRIKGYPEKNKRRLLSIPSYIQEYVEDILGMERYILQEENSKMDS